MEYFYNAHTHVFTFKNVPNKFAKTFIWGLGGLINISKLRKTKFYKRLIKWGPKLNKSDKDILERMINFVKSGEGYGDSHNELEQMHIFENLQGYYPNKTRFIALSMDMEFMHAGDIPEKYEVQIEGLEKIKTKYPNEFYPFIFADPRKFEADPDYINLFKSKLEKLVPNTNKRTFAGIKMYPALGYWPFDKRLEKTYNFAIEHNIPIMVHCAAGVVFDREPVREKHHPIATGIKLEGKKAKDYTINYTNPINYHMLLEPGIVTHWEKENKDFSKLKICIGHFGGASEWETYLNNPWIADKNDNRYSGKHASLKPENWNFDLKVNSGEFTWFSVILDMMEKHSNLYADVSFMLSDKNIWPLLKFTLTHRSEKIRSRILFGTDFYMVAQKSTERDLSIGLRVFLGEELFEQIALTNVEEYLSTKWE